MMAVCDWCQQEMTDDAAAIIAVTTATLRSACITIPAVTWSDAHAATANSSRVAASMMKGIKGS